MMTINRLSADMAVGSFVELLIDAETPERPGTVGMDERLAVVTDR